MKRWLELLIIADVALLGLVPALEAWRAGIVTSGVSWPVLWVGATIGLALTTYSLRHQ